MSRRALLICYYFPPLGLGGVTRPLQLFKLLPSNGYECDVLTVKPVLYRAYEPDLLAGVDTSRIYRSGSRDLQRLLYLLGVRRARSAAIGAGSYMIGQAFPDSKVGWVAPATRLGRRLLRRSRYDILISSSPPVSAHLVAMNLVSESHLPWVADFRDFWHSYPPEEVFKDAGKVFKAKELLKTITQRASAVTAVNQSIADYIGSGEMITNGFDSTLAALWQMPSDTSMFTIGLLGTFNDDLPVEPLLRVLNSLRERFPNEYDRVNLRQVGNINKDWMASQLRTHGLSDRCVMHGLQPRDRTIRLLSAASLFYIGLNPRKETSILPGRMFDFLASGRPILAYAPSESEIARLINQSSNGLCFTDETADCATEYLDGLIKSTKLATLTCTPIPEYARSYSWENVAKRFSHVLDRVV